MNNKASVTTYCLDTEQVSAIREKIVRLDTERTALAEQSRQLDAAVLGHVGDGAPIDVTAARAQRVELNRRLRRTMREIGRLEAALQRDTVERAFATIP